MTGGYGWRAAGIGMVVAAANDRGDANTGWLYFGGTTGTKPGNT